MRFRKSHFSTGEILVLEGEDAASNGCSSKTGVGGVRTASESRRSTQEYNIIESYYINSLDKRKNILSSSTDL